MTDSPKNSISEEVVDRLLSQVPAPPPMSPDLVARITAAAAATPQESKSGRRRELGARRPGIGRMRRRVWVGVIAVNLIAAAAAAAALNVVHYDLRRIADIPALILHHPLHPKTNTPVGAAHRPNPSSPELHPPASEPPHLAAAPKAEVVRPSAAPIRLSQRHVAPSPHKVIGDRSQSSSARRISSMGGRKAFGPHASSFAGARESSIHPAQVRSEAAVRTETTLTGEGELRKNQASDASESLGRDDKPAGLTASEQKADLADRAAKTDAPAENRTDEREAAGRRDAEGAGRRMGRFGESGQFGGRRFRGGGRFGDQGRFGGQANDLGAQRSDAAPERPLGRGRFGRFRRQGPR